jgi:S-DNA-T family DNA segregation ATPase FtsK/SpoIIIE
MKPLTLVVTPTRNRRFNELVGLLLLLASSLLLLALVSYRAADPSLDTAGAQAIHNWTGRVGAMISDLLLQTEGAAAFGLPLLLGVLGLSWLRSRAASAPWIKFAGMALAVAVGPAVFALLPWHLQLFGAIPLGGVVGALLLDSLVAYVNFPGACVLILFFAAISGYLLTSFSFSSARQWLLVRFAFLSAWRDRWVNWRAAHARRKHERQQLRDLARQQRKFDKADNPQLTSAEENKLSGALPGPHALHPQQTPHSPNARAHDGGGFLPRRGAFAEMQEPGTRAMATGWDEDVFAEADLSADPSVDTDAAAGKGTLVKVFEEVLEEVADEIPLPRPSHVPHLVEPRPEPAPSLSNRIAFGERADADQRPVTMTARSVSGFESTYKLPPTTLLHRSEESHEVRQEALRAEAEVLVQKCAEFDVGGQVVQINPGPVVTTFEFRPEAGVKYSRITGLAEDLCLAMAAESILIERMAGKSTVGIQVPNAERETIWLRDIMESEPFATSKSKVAMAMGKDINGKVIVADLATMPHVLIAGSTGSGKSVAINAMIMSVLYKATPEQVRLILVDPKRVELGMYEGIPHLFTPIITEPKLAANALKNAVREMERRLKLLASRSVRNIDQYNRLFDDQPTLWDEQGVEEKPLPYIMIIIDELADLMILDKSNVEEAITRLAQMARAVGIHLVLATQRPSVDVITGLIKANVPTRMSFRLATKIDSRTILDANGAESLLGRGDMLFLPPGTSRVQRVHAPFVTEKEIAGVVSFWKAQGEAQYVEAFLEAPKDAQGRDLDDPNADPVSENDPLFDDAVRLVFEFGKASTSLLQRRMRIGYGRAAALIDMMERDGLVGPPEGSKPRELLKPATWLNESDEALR